MAKSDFDAGREAGIHEGRRLAAEARRRTDLFIMALIVVAVVVVTQVQVRSTERLVEATDAKAREVAQTAFDGCEVRNKIVKRQIRYYRDRASIAKTLPLDELLRKAYVNLDEGVAVDIESVGVRDCKVYLRAADIPDEK